MFYIVMGVSGSGKSTVGKLLSDRLNCQFYDADDFHTPDNITKMSLGKPLSDSDRLPWLLKLQDIVSYTIEQHKTAVMACSALKEEYRQIISGKHSQKITWIYLRGDYNTIYQRIQLRQNHFLKESLLRSQFNTLEEPKNALILDVLLEPKIMIKQIIDRL
jgi:gluconokinase